MGGGGPFQNLQISGKNDEKSVMKIAMKIARCPIFLGDL
jgi:hypothetical protein